MSPGVYTQFRDLGLPRRPTSVRASGGGSEPPAPPEPPPPTGEDGGLSGAFGPTSILSGGHFYSAPYTSVRILTTVGNCVTSSISNVLLGSASLDYKDNAGGFPGSQDDGFYQFELPFPISYNGNTYTYVFVSTNSYITFGDDINDVGYTEYEPTENIPPVDKIFISAYDNYNYLVYYGQEGNTFRLRFEGNSEFDESGTAKVWEAIFYQDTPNQIDIHIGDNGNWIVSP